MSYFGLDPNHLRVIPSMTITSSRLNTSNHATAVPSCAPQFVLYSTTTTTEIRNDKIAAAHAPNQVARMPVFDCHAVNVWERGGVSIPDITADAGYVYDADIATL